MNCGRHGFTSVEVIIGIFTFAILSIGIISLATVATRLAIDSERRVVALALVNEAVEVVRALPYEKINFAPEGALKQEDEVTRNQQTYQLETLIELLDPAGLHKKVQVTASWLIPAGGTRDVQVVTYVAATPDGAESTGQIACTPPTFPGVIKSTANYSSDSFVDDAFVNCKTTCDQDGLPPWQCCGWQVKGTVRELSDPNSIVDIECQCAPPDPLPGAATHHPDFGEYTAFAKACLKGTMCGGKIGTPRCNAACLQGPGDCLCECPN